MLRKVVRLQTCEISILCVLRGLNKLLLGWVLLTTMIVEWQSPLHQATRLTSQLKYGIMIYHSPILF
jgi:hypothetical protein